MKMNYHRIIGIITVAGLIGPSRATDLPINFDKCHRHWPNFTECVSTASTNAIVSMARGLGDGFDIPPLEPLEMSHVTIGRLNGGGISMRQDYDNVEIRGLTKGLTIRYEPIDVTDRLVLRSTARNDRIDFTGDYAVDGHFLVMPIRANGRVSVSMRNVTTKSVIHFESHRDNAGQHFFEATKFEIKLYPEDTRVEFFDLFNGNPLLSRQLKTYFDENSATLFDQARGPFENECGLFLKDIVNKIFSRVPANQIFPE